MLALFLATASAPGAPLDPNRFPVSEDIYAPGDAVTIDTDALQFGPHTGVLDSTSRVAVFTFGELTLTEPVTIVGSRPLALLTRRDLTVRTTLDLRGVGTRGGPGGHDAVPEEDGLGPGGGRSEGMGSGGAFCGDGGEADGQYAGGDAYGDLLATLEGGSSGGSAGDDEGTPGSGGGGAIELGALGILRIEGDILVDGGQVEGGEEYGGGGGAGGGALLHGGLGSECSATITAIGGDGGAASNKGGGGGGGGCIVLLGLGGSCDVDASGGAGGREAEPGDDGTATIVVDPDQDGDLWTLSDGDCNDNDPDSRPGGHELPCDGIDQDCDGYDLCEVDGDGDGVPPPYDCDDADPLVHPTAAEIPGDGVDQNCDGLEDCYVDADGDGFGEPGVPVVPSAVLDCLAPGLSPNDADVCPGADDRLDRDGDGVPDDCDACPEDAAPGHDRDGDGVCNSDDVCGGDDASGDSDGDGLCDDVDQCEGVDTDNDGACDDVDRCPGHPDHVDVDRDGVPDGCDPCPADPDGCDPAGDRDPAPPASDAGAGPAGCGCGGSGSSAGGWAAVLLLAAARRRRPSP